MATQMSDNPPGGDLIALAERCEAATKGSYALDDEIAVALGWVEYSEECDNDYIDEGWHSPDGSTHAWHPFWTRRLEDTMSLVPEGHAFGCGSGTNDAEVEGWAWCGPDEGPFRFAATPALALTAACLRARATLKSEPKL